MRRMLRLSPDTREFRVAFGATSSSPSEIAILSRSVFRILTELAAFVDVPGEHLAASIAPPVGDGNSDDETLFHIWSSTTKPCNPYAAVCYEGRWFWIEKGDFQSKRAMTTCSSCWRL